MDSTDKKEAETAEQFLSRWSRRKQQVRQEEAAPPAKTQPAAEAPPLPPVESLTPDSDFSGFLHPEVDDKLRRAALKKLFSDPHFNVMDGLDVYIDDYSKDDPIPEAMMKELRHAQDILVAAEERREKARREDEAAAAAQDAKDVGAEAPQALPAAEVPHAAADAEAPAAAQSEARCSEKIIK